MSKMSWLRVFALSASIVGLTSSSALAVTLNTDAGAQFRTWTTPSLNSAGGAGFWDNPSEDAPGGSGGVGCNIGYWMAGAASTSTCTNVTPGSAINPTGNYSFLSSSSGRGSNVSGFSFTTNFPNFSEFRLAVAGMSAGNEFGYYRGSDLPGMGGSLSTGNAIVDGGRTLFAGGTSVGTTSMLFPTGSFPANFGFYLRTTDGFIFLSNGEVYFNGGSGSTFNRVLTGSNNFALFVAPGTTGNANGASVDNFFIAAEDKPISRFGNYTGNLADRDFQDLVVRITAVPEPAEYAALLGLGSAVMFYVRRRRAQTAAE